MENNKHGMKNPANYTQGTQITLSGAGMYNNICNFYFAPDATVPGMVPPFRRYGVGQQLSDGSFDFIPYPKQKSQSKLIHKLAHGRASVTKDQAIQLTLKVFSHEQINVTEALLRETIEAINAIREYQLKK